MSQKSICSRREADFCIQNKWVLVNGECVSKLGSVVSEDVSVTLTQDGKNYVAQKISIMLNKPIKYVSHKTDKDYALAVDLLTPRNFFISKNRTKRPYKSNRKSSSSKTRDSFLQSGKADIFLTKLQLRTLAPAGRLDIESKGLLVLTQDGRLAKQIVGPESLVEKEYLVRVDKKVALEDFAHLRHGLSLDEQPLKPAEVTCIDDCFFKMVLIEGRKRQIRRMCELLGLRVTSLKRVRIGSLTLGDLPEGRWRFISLEEQKKGFLKK